MLEKMAESGAVPLALQNRPFPTEWTIGYYAGFMLVSDSRASGMGGISSIPLSEIVALLGLYGITDMDERETWVRMIRVLDAAYVTHYAAKQKADQERRSR